MCAYVRDDLLPHVAGCLTPRRAADMTATAAVGAFLGRE